MLFLIHFEFDPENRDKSIERLKTSGAGMPENVKPVGLWYSATLLEGWSIVEAVDSTALGQHMNHWTDLNVNHITLVLSPEEVLKIVS